MATSPIIVRTETGLQGEPAGMRATPETLRDLLAQAEGDLARRGDGDELHDVLAFIAAEALRQVAVQVGLRRDTEDTLRFALTARFKEKPVGHVYVAISADRAMIKVGHTRQRKVETRIRQLREAGGKPWRLLSAVIGTRKQESALHRTIEGWRVDKLEYYRRTPRLMAHLREYGGGYLQLPLDPPS